VIAFLAAFALFVLLHSLPAVPTIRSGIILHVGRPFYFVCYSLASTLALVWLFSAALALDYIPLWELRPWHAAITFVLAPLGGFLVIAGLLSPNPLSISIRSSGVPGAITRISRHPVLWGFAMWAIGHIAANGDLRSLLLFGGFALFALGAIPVAERRAKRRLGENWAILSAGTSVWPLAGCFEDHPPSLDRDLLVALVGSAALVGWLLFAGGHSMLFGADPVAIFG
jgi:uncharacterized membrane protein